MTIVLTPLAAELKALHESWGVSPLKGAGGAFEIRSGLQTAVGGHGKVEFGLRTLQLIQLLRPSLVVCAGTCGLLAPEVVSPLDVVVGTMTVEHDFKSSSAGEPPRFLGCSITLEKLRRGQPSGVHFGAIASGDEDVLSLARAGEIHAATGALAVAWEGAGGARACRMMQTPFIEIRGVSDHADASAIADFRRNLRAAMARVGEVVESLIL